MMGVFNNLVMYDQHVPQNSLQTIVPDLATGWSWSEDGTELTLPVREGVSWHDGNPFTSSTSLAGDRARLAAQWSRRPRDCGACRPRC
jgi:MarR-like DNA-binding transcriptional regulator SgrR of sgrS sRNA